MSTARSTPPGWRKSSYSELSECVEVAIGETVSIRDSKHPDGPVLKLSRVDWTRFLGSVSGTTPFSRSAP